MAEMEDSIKGGAIEMGETAFDHLSGAADASIRNLLLRRMSEGALIIEDNYSTTRLDDSATSELQDMCRLQETAVVERPFGIGEGFTHDELRKGQVPQAPLPAGTGAADFDL